ncbi:PHAF1 protein At3g51130, partial [Linum grandiflorum]
KGKRAAVEFKVAKATRKTSRRRRKDRQQKKRRKSLAVRIPENQMMQQQHHQRSRPRCEGTAMGAIVLDLRPGLGIGPFSLGMPICEAFAQIEQQPNLYDVVHVKYYDEEPLKLDIVISFPDHGFHLRFDPWSQRLRLVEIFDVKRLQLRYATSIIGGPGSLATFVAVYSLFGPTFPGIYDKDRGVYTLFYPGLSFAFPIPGQYADCCQDREAELPLEFPDGTTPVTCRVCVYDGSSDKKVGVGSLLDKAVTPPLPSGSLYMEEVQVKLREELFFSIGGQHIPFGASPQDVWTELGRPCGIHQKQVDQMVIHSASDPSPRTTLCADYFYNYFTRGLDILFDGQTHKIKKFVLHSNYPGHADFNSYIKCNFVIQVNNSKQSITPSTKWEQVKEILGDCGRAAIQTQGSTSNPFGSTFVYGYQNIALEVMKNGHIATITLFQS